MENTGAAPEDRRSPGVPIDFPSNAHRKKAAETPKERPAVEKVITGTAIQRKKSFGKKAAELFVGEDVNNVLMYVFGDVMVPAIKTTLSDMVSEGIERLLFGDTRRSRSTRVRKPVPNYTSYNRYYDTASSRPLARAEPQEQREMSSRAKATHDFDEIILNDRGDAEQVLDKLTELIDTYGLATVEDLYDAVDITSTYTDQKWGWHNLASASVSRVREGYLLNLPKPVPIV